MTPAERQFSDVEGGLKRGQCLVRVIREITSAGFSGTDAVLWDGIYAIACEAETALDEASKLWDEAHRKIGPPT